MSKSTRPETYQELAARHETLGEVALARVEELEDALGKIAQGVRSDGTYNLSREACEQIAKEALGGSLWV